MADAYREQSLKNPERIKRGTSSRVMMRSALSKMPRNFKDFLKNGENKSEQKRIYIGFGNGKSRKILHLDSVGMNSDLKSASTGFHAFTGNDYLSCIFRKSKKVVLESSVEKQ